MRASLVIQTEITEVRAAIKAVLFGQKYSLDTGQSKQMVERADLGALQKWILTLESELSVTELREGGTQISRGISC